MGKFPIHSPKIVIHTLIISILLGTVCCPDACGQNSVSIRAEAGTRTPVNEVPFGLEAEVDLQLSPRVAVQGGVRMDNAHTPHFSATSQQGSPFS